MVTLLPLRGSHGFSVIEASIALALITAGGLFVAQLSRDAGLNMKKNYVQNARLQTLAYYADLLKDTRNRARTLESAANLALKNHSDGSAPLAPVNPATIDLTVLDSVTGLPLGMRPLEIYRNGPGNSAVLEVPATGLHLKDNGQRCPEASLPAQACEPSKSTFVVRGAWLPLSGNQFETQILVEHVKLEGTDIQLKTMSSAHLEQYGFWAPGAANSIHNSNGGNVGIGTDTPAATLDVNGAATFRSTIAVTGNVTTSTAVTDASVGNALTTKTYVDTNKTSFANQGACPTGNVLAGFDASGNKACVAVDPGVGGLVEGKWCRVTGGRIQCDVDPPPPAPIPGFAAGVCVGSAMTTCSPACPGGYNQEGPVSCDTSGPIVCVVACRQP